MEPTEGLREYVEEKVAKVYKYMDKPIEASVVLSVEKHRHIAEISLVANRVVVNGKEETESMYSSIDLVIDKIERQLRRYKERLKKRKNINAKLKNITGRINILTAESLEKEEDPKVIKSKNLSIKPMFIEEAAMQLELSSNEFLVFTNASSEKVNVIYKRRDRNYGLIEPDY
jgi:putative sigma-54 modulation protein